MSLKGFPVVNMYCTDDKIIDDKQAKKWGTLLGVEPNCYDHYNKDGELISEGNYKFCGVSNFVLGTGW